MAMSLSSCSTVLSRAPPPPPGKSSPAAGLQLLRSRQPAAASVAALRWASPKESRSRAALFVCHADTKYNIEPSALVHPRKTGVANVWSLQEDENANCIILRLNVGESTTVNDLEIVTTEDQTLLVIRYKKEGGDKSSSNQERSMDIRLLMPPGYDSGKMKGILNSGWLNIDIPKPEHKSKEVKILPSENNP